MGRRKIESITHRKWWKENIKQVRYEEMPDWDHLIWTGEGIGRYKAPRVTCDAGEVNVRKAIWHAAFKEMPGTSQKLVPNCDEDNCVSPHHMIKMTKAEADAAAANPDGYSREKPWLRAGKRGTKWDDFAKPHGIVAAHVMRRALWTLDTGIVPKRQAWVATDPLPAIVVDVLHIDPKMRLWITGPGVWRTPSMEWMLKGVVDCKWVRGLKGRTVAEVGRFVEERVGAPRITLDESEDHTVIPWTFSLPIDDEEDDGWDLEEPAY